MKKLAILGTGCAKCTKLEENTRLAVQQTGLDCEVAKITDIQEIMQYGVMITPALVIDGEVKSVGKVLPVDSIFTLLS